MTSENQSRALTASGLLLSLVAYLLFLGAPSPWNLLAWPTAVTAVAASCYGLWRRSGDMTRLILLCAVLWAAVGHAQDWIPWGRTARCQPGDACYVAPRVQPRGTSGVAAVPHPAICMVFADGNPTPHTGALIDKGDRIGIVVSVPHGGQRLNSEIVVQFPNRRRYQGTMVSIDRDDDLAAIRIAAPEGISPIRIAETPAHAGDRVWYAGYGQPGGYRRFDCLVTGYTPIVGQGKRVVTLIVQATARNYDSGAPIMNGQNELVAVLSCSNAERNETLGMYCGVVRTFIDAVISPPMTPMNPPDPERPPPPPGDPTFAALLDELRAQADADRQRIDALLARVEELEATIPGGEVDLDALAEAVIERLPPLYFQPGTETNPVGAAAAMRPGDTLFLHGFLVDMPD